MIEIDKFVSRHIGPRNEDIGEMLKLINCSSLDELIEKTVPNHIIFKDKLNLDLVCLRSLIKLILNFYL